MAKIREEGATQKNMENKANGRTESSKQKSATFSLLRVSNRFIGRTCTKRIQAAMKTAGTRK